MAERRYRYWVVETFTISGVSGFTREAGPFDDLDVADREMLRLGETGRYRDDFGGVPLAVEAEKVSEQGGPPTA